MNDHPHPSAAPASQPAARLRQKALAVPGPAHQAECDLLILSDGTVLAHNLTPAMADMLQALNPSDPILRERARGAQQPPAAAAARARSEAPSSNYELPQ